MLRRMRRPRGRIRRAEARKIEHIDECPENLSEAFYLTNVDDLERGGDVDDDGKPILPTKRVSN
jgi:hypothetical protein